MSKAPWTNEQVAALNAYQQAGVMHPFTCPNRSEPGHVCDPEWGRGDKGVLRATNDGWVCTGCDYTQDWAHDFMEKPIAHDPHMVTVRNLAARERLWNACMKWVQENKPLAPECFYQMDNIAVALPELGEIVCQHVGYYEPKEDE